MKRILLIVLGIIIITSVVIVYLGYTQLYASVVNEDQLIQVSSNLEYEDVKKILSENQLIKNEAVFDQLAAKMNFIKSPMRSGQYKLSEGWGTYDLIRHLRNGSQEGSNLVVNINWTVDRVAGKLDDVLEIDSFDIMNAITDKALQEELGYTQETAMAMFIPNTYEVYWNTSGADLLRRLKKESKAFWAKNDRMSKAEALDMSPEEVYTLASIVERETNAKEEKQRMAGLYLNRIRIGMPLQADPTVKFGIGDLGIKRVLFEHLEYDSPYNTYIYTGLPPGPISMASISSIDAVLNAEKHNYLYFCRKPDGTGLHTFAKSLTQHNVNARAYHRWFRKNFGSGT